MDAQLQEEVLHLLTEALAQVGVQDVEVLLLEQLQQG